MKKIKKVIDSSKHLVFSGFDIVKKFFGPVGRIFNTKFGIKKNQEIENLYIENLQEAKKQVIKELKEEFLSNLNEEELVKLRKEAYDEFKNKIKSELENKDINREFPEKNEPNQNINNNLGKELTDEDSKDFESFYG
jgi:sugar-specific transcriptional regulator TrmB